MIQNPILKGFNPDPSICRVGDDYYIATSTFEWFPGVQIHHSKDLKNWKLIAQPLNRISQLDMKGVPYSCGVWAPCLSYKNGTFYLVYTNVKSFDGVWKDTPNYVITSQDILGDWSEATYLTSAGFDGSFFHDTDGKTWCVNMLVDHRQIKFFGGIELQEYDTEKKELIGETFYLTGGTDLGLTEGPHLYKRNGYYYLILAEGGTEYSHAETVMRSKKIIGPYESHPTNPILTSWHAPTHALQKSGHASLIETQTGDWYIAFLVGRPLSTKGRCVLGRETAIEELVWIKDWPYLKSGDNLPRIEIPESNLKEHIFEEDDTTDFDDFDSDVLNLKFQSLRIPKSENWISLTDRPGFLRLKGKESLSSTHQQSLIARRLEDFDVKISTSIRFEPENFKQLAGLILYYNTGHYHYLNVTKRGDNKVIMIISCCNFIFTEQKELAIITGQEEIILRAKIIKDTLQFSYKLKVNNFKKIGKKLDMSILSDDFVREGSKLYRPAFTGCFVGMCCQDLVTNKNHADFDWFKYKPI